MSDKWEALERLRIRAAGGNHADEDCNIINQAFRALEQQVKKWELEAKRLYGVGQDIEEMRVALEQRVEGLEEALEKIIQWSEAYPLDIFPEPDFKKAQQLLKAGGMTLDAISASNMRHVIERVGGMAKAALAAEENRVSIEKG